MKEHRGSIMLETVLVLPIFVLLVFFVIQMTFVWTAKQMTYYAAYCGARATLVYNPEDYGATKQSDGSWKTGGPIRRGVVHHTACSVLSWISWSIGGVDFSGGKNMLNSSNGVLNSFSDFKIGTYSVPLSSNIRNQVTVEVSEFEKIGGDNKTSGGKSSGGAASIDEQFPASTVRVSFRFPLFIPLGGPLIAYFFGAKQAGIETNGAISVGGFAATNGSEIHSAMEASGNFTDTNSWRFYSIVLEESCTMAKPYKTDTFPLMAADDKKMMGMSN